VTFCKQVEARDVWGPRLLSKPTWTMQKTVQDIVVHANTKPRGSLEQTSRRPVGTILPYNCQMR